MAIKLIKFHQVLTQVAYFLENELTLLKDRFKLYLPKDGIPKIFSSYLLDDRLLTILLFL